MLDAKLSVLALWYTSDCHKCGKQLWDVNYSVFAFGTSQQVCFEQFDHAQYLVAANTFNKDDELVKKYDIQENHDEVTLRLFVKGNDEPLIMDEDDNLVY